MFWRVRQLFGQIKFSLRMKLQSRYFFRPFIHTWYIQLWSWWFLCHGLEDRFPKKICHVQDFWHALAKGSKKNHQLGQIYIINTWSLYSAWPCFQHTMTATHVNSKKAPQTRLFWSALEKVRTDGPAAACICLRRNGIFSGAMPSTPLLFGFKA